MIAIGGWQHRWMDEDAFINLRIVDQIFAGHGPVFNAGERVESATSALWLVILVIARLLFGSFASMEWITTLASLAAAVAAFAVAGKATRALHRGEDGFVVPVGLILVAAVAVVWDFSTSGLEMGLVWLWLAGAWYVLVSVARTQEISTRRRFWFAFVLGLAPLVRPDLTLMLVFMLGAWFVLVRPRRIVFDLVAILALPVAYQIFRMGYYATLVPTTALAKDAGGLHLDQGWAYAKNFIGPYRLWLTAILVVATIVYRTLARRDRRVALVDRGDARIRARARAVHHRDRRRLHARPVAAAGVLRARAAGLDRDPHALARPRRAGGQATLLDHGHDRRARRGVGRGECRGVPTTEEHRLVRAQPDQRLPGRVGSEAAPERHAVRVERQRGRRALRTGCAGVLHARSTSSRCPAKVPHSFFLTLGSVGVPAYDAGRRIWVIDIGGLAEPLAARSAPHPDRVAGHRKQIDDAWYDARFAASDVTRNPKDAAARHALTCGPIPGLLAAVDDKMTPGRFFSNIWHSVSYTRLRIPFDPAVAEREWCRP